MINAASHQMKAPVASSGIANVVPKLKKLKDHFLPSAGFVSASTQIPHCRLGKNPSGRARIINDATTILALTQKAFAKASAPFSPSELIPGIFTMCNIFVALDLSSESNLHKDNRLNAIV